MSPDLAWTLREILAATGGKLLAGPNMLAGMGISIDSRRTGPGRLFISIRGRRHDGHDFIFQALEAGALAVIMNHDKWVLFSKTARKFPDAAWIGVADTTVALGDLARFHRQKFDLPLVALTGSSGKTTTRNMVASVLATRFKTLATAGNLNNEIGLPLTLFKLKPFHQVAVAELGMNHAGEIDRLASICRPTIGLITNVGTAHVGLLGSVEAVAEAKAELIFHLPENGHLVLNGDDRRVTAMADRAGCAVILYGTTADCMVRAEAAGITGGRTFFRLCLPQQTMDVKLRLLGRFSVSNALAAAAVGCVLDIPPADIVRGLEAAEPAPGRLNLITTSGGVVILDDTYNANPESTEAALETMVATAGGNRCFAVLGDMLELGDQAPALHRRVGRFAAFCRVDRLFATGQMAGELAAGALAGGLTQDRVVTGSKRKIASILLEDVEKTDHVLVKGSRAMAMETIVEDLIAGLGGISK